jgi:hypothetical protein
MMAKNKALLLILLLSSTTSQFISASAGAAGGTGGGKPIFIAAANGKVTIEDLGADDKEDAEPRGGDNPLHPKPAAKQGVKLGRGAMPLEDDLEIDDLQGARPPKGSPEWLRLRVEKLEGEKKHLADQLSAHNGNNGLYNIDEAIREFTKHGEPSDEHAKHAYKATLQALLEKKALARISPEFFALEGAQRAAAERGYEQAVPLALRVKQARDAATIQKAHQQASRLTQKEKINRIKEEARIARATRDASALRPEDLDFLKGQLSLKAQMDAHYHGALSDATPFHRELRSAIKEGFVGGISNGVGQATGTYIVRAIDWFVNGVYWNNTERRKRRDAAIAEAQREERMMQQRVHLNHNSGDLEHTANASERAKKLIQGDIQLLEQDRAELKKLLVGFQPIVKEAAVKGEAEAALEAKVAELEAVEKEKKTLADLKDQTKQTKESLNALLKKEKELHEELYRLEAKQKAATERIDAHAAQLDEDLKDIVINGNMQNHQQQTEFIGDELEKAKRQLKKVEQTDAANARKIDALKQKVQGLQDAVKLLNMQTDVCMEMTNAETFAPALRDHTKVQVFELFLTKNKTMKNAEIAQAREQARSLSAQLVQRLDRHNSAHLKFCDMDEAELDADIQSLQGEPEPQAKAAA